MEKEGVDIQDLHPQAPALYVALGSDGNTFKIGTCEHCVLYEQGRPDRAWDADGDKALDFDRDTYYSYLGRLGVLIHNPVVAYVCP